MTAAAPTTPVYDRLPVQLLAGVFGALALANMWSYVAFEPHPRAFAADFNALWAAGKVWIDGQSPYSNAHAQALEAAQAPFLHDQPPPFFYPPATIAVFGLLGFFPLGEASLVWSVVSFASLIAASAFFAAFATARAGRRRLFLFFAHLAVAGLFWDASEVIGAHNNGDFFFYAAFVATLLGAKRGGGALFVAALTVALMRPQLGLALWAAAAAAPSLRAGALAAAAATAFLSLAGLWNDGAGASLLAFLNNLSVYGSFPENGAAHTGGALFLVWAATGLQTSAFLWAGLAPAAAALVSARCGEPPHRALVVSVAAALFLLPAHNTYYLALTPALFLFGSRSLSGALTFGGGLLLMKSWTLARALADAGAGYLQIDSAAIDTVGAALVASGVLFTVVERRLAAAAQNLTPPPEGGVRKPDKSPIEPASAVST